LPRVVVKEKFEKRIVFHKIKVFSIEYLVGLPEDYLLLVVGITVVGIISGWDYCGDAMHCVSTIITTTTINTTNPIILITPIPLNNP
jgi:hypothetical protein